MLYPVPYRSFSLFPSSSRFDVSVDLSLTKYSGLVGHGAFKDVEMYWERAVPQLRAANDLRSIMLVNSNYACAVSRLVRCFFFLFFCFMVFYFVFLTHKLIYQGKFAEAQVSCNNSFKMACEIGDTTQYGVSSYLLCCAVLCCAVLCCAVLCCAVLCCAVLCCAVLCCAVLCCAVLTLYRFSVISDQLIFHLFEAFSLIRMGNAPEAHLKLLQVC